MTAIPRFVKLWRSDPEDDRTRLRLEFPAEAGLKVENLPGAYAELVDERVLPEQLMNPDARHVRVLGRICINRNDMERLHAALGELLAIIPKDPA